MRAALFAVALGLVVALSSASRLTERPITLDLGTDIVDPTGSPRRMAGYFKLNRTHDAHMFYFFFESRNSPKDDPVVIWMTGGPGCSSELAVFYENGPYHINKDLSLRESEHGWDVNNNMIFVDQPIGTGFSYTDDERDEVFDEKTVGNDMLDFLLEFFEAHPHLAGNDLFVTGESYAGHYVPAVSHRLWKAERSGKYPDKIHFKGLAIGNGLTDPAIQYGAYADFALDNKLISRAVHDSIQMSFPLCRFAINWCNYLGWYPVCYIAFAYCNGAIFTPIRMARPDINVYDIRKQCVGPLCYDFDDMQRLLDRDDIREQLGVGDRPWQSCSPDVYQDFIGDWMRRYDTMLPEMLADGVRVLIYAGDQDLICNYYGNRRWVDALEWEHSEDWQKASDEDWTVDGSAAGSIREVDGLAFLQIFKAGHMVPMDQPAAGLEMITRFTRNKAMTTTASMRSAFMHGETQPQ